jgi:hypothetical protein
MSIETEEELEGLRRAGHVVAVVLREVRRRVHPGVTTGELDALAGRVFARHGARSAPKLVYDAPCEIFISVDDEAVHAVPGPRRLRRGDLVKLDVTAELDGFYADACITVPAGPLSPRAARVVRAAGAALARGMKAAVGRSMRSRRCRPRRGRPDAPARGSRDHHRADPGGRRPRHHGGRRRVDDPDRRRRARRARRAHHRRHRRRAARPHPLR